MMEFTFGIVTSGTEDNNLNKIVDSIEKQNIPNYEILIIGNSKIVRDNTKIINFDDDKHSKILISRKKNIITNLAKLENIVYMHDYIILSDDWYTGYLKFGNDFDLCMNKIINYDATRYRDWCICMWNDPTISNIIGQNNPTISNIVGSDMKCLLPYDENRFIKHMYFSGAYWVSKRKVMMEFPLNDELDWGEGEDVEWSIRVRNAYNFCMNKYSSVELLKYKDAILNSADDETIQKLVENLLKSNN
jgi:hypothetical protein